MKDDINLIVGTHEKKKKNSRIVLISGVVFSILFVISAALILYTFFLSSQVSALDSQANELRSRIASLSTQKVQMLSLNERLVSIRKIINTRQDIDANVATMLSFVPENFSIDGVTANEERVTLKLSSANLADFDVLLEERIPQYYEEKPKDLRRIEVGTFAHTTTGYSINLDFYFGKPAAPQQRQQQVQP